MDWERKGGKGAKKKKKRYIIWRLRFTLQLPNEMCRLFFYYTFINTAAYAGTTSNLTSLGVCYCGEEMR